MSTQATMENIKLQLTRVFDAPRELVFKAWTDENQFNQWFGAAACNGSSLESTKVDARVGGKYRLQVRSADGEYFTSVGVYREVKPPERLVFTWQWLSAAAPEGGERREVPLDAVDVETLVTVDFAARAGGTLLTITHQRFKTDAETERHGAGWTGALAELPAYLDALRGEQPP